MQTPSGKGVPFVSRKTGNNGISAFVKPIEGVKPAPAGEITCALGGAVLMTYVQEVPFYVGRDVAILKPKKAMTKAEILFYCLCIRSNRYRYNYGRQANKTLAGLKVPCLDAIATWVNASNLEPFEGVSLANSAISPEPLNADEWKNFRYDEIFETRKGCYNKKPPETGITRNPVPFIGVTEYNNGITSYYSMEDISNYSRSREIENQSNTEKKYFLPMPLP